MSILNIFEVSGGLGNQIFQIAAASNFSFQNKTTVYLDISPCLLSKVPEQRFGCGGLIRHIYLNRANIRLLPGPQRLVSLAKKTFSHQYMQRLLGQYVCIENERQPYTFHPIPISKATFNLYKGCWQSEKYFSTLPVSFASLVSSYLDSQFPGIMPKISSEMLPKVAVHIRRGDYRKLTGYGLLSNDYYEAAIGYIKEKIGNCMVVIFSDEIDGIFKEYKGVASVFFNDLGMAPIEVLGHMASCDHFVTANSSFSWWAAYLGRNPNKIVVTPKRWFRDREKTPDLIPERWIEIDNLHV